MAADENTVSTPSTPNIVEEGLKDLHLQNEDLGSLKSRTLSRNIKRDNTMGNDTPSSTMSRTHSLQSPKKPGSSTHSSTVSTPKNEDSIPSSVTLKQQPGQPLKLTRSTSQKVAARTPPTFLDHPTKTDEAKDTFQVIPRCIYSTKAIGATDHAMDCECTEEWGESVHIL